MRVEQQLGPPGIGKGVVFGESYNRCFRSTYTRGEAGADGTDVPDLDHLPMEPTFPTSTTCQLWKGANSDSSTSNCPRDDATRTISICSAIV